MSTRPAPATFLQTPEQLAEHLGLPVEPLSAVHAVYPLRISRYYLDLIRQVGPLLPTMMASRFAAAQQAGQLNPDLDPRLLMVSLIGLTMFPMASAPIWRQLFGADDIDFNDLRRHTLVLLDRGLELDHAK